MSIFSSRRGSQVGVPPQQKIKTGKNQKQKSIPIFRIYMVGFPHHESISGSLSIPDIVSELVPEAIVHEYQVLLGHNGGENIAQDWIVKEAISLLWRIQEDTQKEPTLASAKVLVAGYGLGGIILKEAIVVANTDSAFYDVSFQIFSLVFFDTMDKPTDLQSWEGLTHHMIGLTFTSDRVRASLYSVASRLAMSVSAVSTSFLRFIPKYSIRHYTGTADLSRIICDANVTDHGDVDDPGLGYYHSSIPLRTLRVCFAPNEVLLVGPDAGLEAGMNETYWTTLRVLSSSERIIYRSTMPGSDSHTANMSKIYHDLITGVKMWEIQGGSVQVHGSDQQSRSTVIKLLVQHIQTTSIKPVVQVQFWSDNSDAEPLTVYKALTSSIHQLLSQMPRLFTSIQAQMSQLLHQRAWTDRCLVDLFSHIISNAKETDFLFVVDNWASHSWDTAVKLWLGTIPSLCDSEQSNGSTITFLIGNDEVTAEVPFHNNQRCISLSEGIEARKTEFIGLQADQGLRNLLSSTLSKEERRSKIRDQIVHAGQAFKGSLTDSAVYLSYLLQRPHLGTTKSIQELINSNPNTDVDLYKACIQRVLDQELNVRSWAISALSWTLFALRPLLATRELATATAIPIGNVLDLDDMEDCITLDVESDVDVNLLGLVYMDNEHARIVSPLARSLLCRENVLQLMGDGALAMGCLQYLSALLGDRDGTDTWETCLSLFSDHTQPMQSKSPKFDLLDYAVRFWPTHFLRVSNPADDLLQVVVDFFKATHVATRWFQLYLACHSPSLAIPTSDPPSPAEMASFVGLTSVIPNLCPNPLDLEIKNAVFKHGSMEHDIHFLPDTELGWHLECCISTDDVGAVESLLLEAGEYFCQNLPLHVASVLGSTRAVELLLKKIGYPMERDSEGRTPLHLAAIAGRYDIIEVLLSQLQTETGSAQNGTIAAQVKALDKHEQTPLMLATKAGHLKAAKLLAEYDKNDGLITEDVRGRTPIHYAAQGSLQILQHFLALTSEGVRSKDCLGLTPLHLAAKKGSVPATKAILQAAEELGHRSHLLLDKDNSDRLPLYYAAENGGEDLVLALIQEMKDCGINLGDAGVLASIDIAAERGQLKTLETFCGQGITLTASLLTRAAACGQLMIVLYLLETHGMDPNGAPGSEHTPLGLAASHGFKQVVRTLLHFKADLKLADTDRRTPLHLAAKAGKAEVAAILLQHKREHAQTPTAIIEAPDSLRFTPLHLAVSEGNVEICRLLIDNGANLQASNTSLKTPLHLAVANAEIVNLLLGAGARVSGAVMQSSTPLHHAVRRGAVESVRLLIENKADIAALDDSGKPPPFYAIGKGSSDLLELLLGTVSATEYPEKLQWDLSAIAVWKGELECLKTLVDKFPGVAVRTGVGGESLLHIAASRPEGPSNPATVKFLLNLDQVDVNALDDSKQTPLHTAAGNGNTQVVQALISHGADVDLPDMKGRTALFLACCSGRTACVKELFQHNANISHCAHEGWSPLHGAIAAENVEICEMLIEKGAEVNQQMSDGWTPLHLACHWGLPKVTECLLQNGADPNIESPKAWTPFHQALLEGDDETSHIVSSHPKTRKYLLPAMIGRVSDLPEQRRQQALAIMEKQILEDDSRLLNAPLDNLYHLAKLDLKETGKIWDLLELKMNVQSRTDKDGWNLGHLHYQSSSGQQFPSWVENAILQQTRTPTAITFPEKWRCEENDHERLKIDPNGVEIIFSDNPEPVTVRSDHPFPPQNHNAGIVYFEATIHHLEVTQQCSVPLFIGIGFTEEHVDHSKALIGWKDGSVGYHGDDGGLFSPVSGGKAESRAKTFGPGNTVGCGIDYNKGKYFFTMDGDTMIEQSSDIIFRKLYPAVSHRHLLVKITINFGKEKFVWRGAMKGAEVDQGSRSLDEVHDN